MIIGNFGQSGTPWVTGSITFPALFKDGSPISDFVVFVLNTGAEATCIHDQDAGRLEIPFDQLKNLDASTRGVGGKSEYYLEPAYLTFIDDNIVRVYNIELRIAKPAEDEEDAWEEHRATTDAGLPSLLGRDVLNNWLTGSSSTTPSQTGSTAP